MRNRLQDLVCLIAFISIIVGLGKLFFNIDLTYHRWALYYDKLYYIFIQECSNHTHVVLYS